MSASHVRTLANDTKSTFILYALLRDTWRHGARANKNSEFELFAWVIQPNGGIAFESLPIDTILVSREMADSDLARLIHEGVRSEMMGGDEAVGLA